ncbi:hypothetical protein SAMN02745866_01001 [Alteromonadaceae bacterium Bs31]|nr:hypothetical protein SAMN02745866_01001 [Alteromonadaceae bacterium Bs31]
MLKLLAYAKDIVIVFGFIYGMSAYLKSAFQLNLFQVVAWWIKNFSSTDYAFPLLFGLFFSLFGGYTAWSSAIHGTYVSFLGDSVTKLYVGNIAKKAYFVEPENLTAKPFESVFVVMPNFTFEHIYTKTPFVKEKGTDRVGSAKQSQTLRNLIAPVSFGLVLGLILWVMLHIMGYQAYVAKNFEYESQAPTMRAAFTEQAQSIGLTPKHLTFVGMALCIIGLVGYLRTPPYTYGKQAIDIGGAIYPGAKVQGRALKVKKIYRNDRQQDIGAPVDTGRRIASFEFQQGLPTPVYVNYFFEEEPDKPGLFDDINSLIENNAEMSFIVTPELALSLPAVK